MYVQLVCHTKLDLPILKTVGELSYLYKRGTLLASARPPGPHFHHFKRERESSQDIYIPINKNSPY